MDGVVGVERRDTGLILWIGNWILHEASRQLSAWNLQFHGTQPFTMAVNISAKQFAQADLVTQIGHILGETGLAPEDLRLELTESVTMRDEERTTRILSELRKLGVRLCIDDFGTGYSSLSYLRRFALDILKIDRSFVSDMLKNSESLEIVKTILSLGSNLGMKVIAEGATPLPKTLPSRSLSQETTDPSKPRQKSFIQRWAWVWACCSQPLNPINSACWVPG